MHRTDPRLPCPPGPPAWLRLVVVLVPLVGACAAAPPPAPAPVPVVPQRVGGDADAHGCIGSAGYEWCAKTARCERPWELVVREGIDHSAAQVAAWCAAPR